MTLTSTERTQRPVTHTGCWCWTIWTISKHPSGVGRGSKYGYFWGQNRTTMAGSLPVEEPTWKLFYEPYHISLHYAGGVQNVAILPYFTIQYYAIPCNITLYYVRPHNIKQHREELHLCHFLGAPCTMHISGITTENNKKIFSISSRDVRLCGKIFAFVSKYKTENRKFSFSSWNTRINDVNSRTRLKSWNWHPAAKPFVCWEKLSDDPYGVPSIPQSSPDVHISCQNWRKVGISGLPLQKGRSRMQCVWEPGELRGKIVKKKYECDHI